MMPFSMKCRNKGEPPRRSGPLGGRFWNVQFAPLEHVNVITARSEADIEWVPQSAGVPTVPEGVVGELSSERRGVARRTSPEAGPQCRRK